ncbi:MAG: phospholipase D-like domain-containing protein [Patescibacteria group bacterium]|nr:phospholipase D-like domain-containing protein [Patescibacteria group bacterium]
MFKSEYEEVLRNRRNRRLKRLKTILTVILVAILVVAIFYSNKPIPVGLDSQSQEFITNDDDLNLIADLSYIDSAGQKMQEHKIFDTILDYIDKAEQYILLDYHLFNDGHNLGMTNSRLLAEELTNKLVEKKQSMPDIKIDFIYDPINTGYTNTFTTELGKLKRAGINLIPVNLNKLRDSNPFYSAAWRLALSWFGGGDKGFFNNPLGDTLPKVTFRGLAAFPNFKSDYRSVFLADNNSRLISIIGSFNPHGLSADNSNIAWLIKGSFGTAVYDSEAVVATMSGNGLSYLPDNLRKENTTEKNEYYRVKLLTEGEVQSVLDKAIKETTGVDVIYITSFYLSDRHVVSYLKSAAKKGVSIKILLDPNKDYFGYHKSGLPNTAVAKELVKKFGDQISVRWCNTTGEQYHANLFIIVYKNQETAKIISGSANLTAKNLHNYNLTSNIVIDSVSQSRLVQEAISYFDKLWSNQDGRQYTLDYSAFKQPWFLQTWGYRLAEWTGFCSY